MDPRLLADLVEYLKTAPDPICPACAQARIDPRSPYGWCPRCTGRREAQLRAKRNWWNENRGANAPEELKASGKKKGRDDEAE